LSENLDGRNRPRPYAAGLDAGGSFTKGAVVDRDGRIVARLRVPSDHGATGPAIGRGLAGIVRRMLMDAGLSDDDLAGVCISAPGVVDAATQIVHSCPNLQNWDGLAVGALVASELGLPTILENDANQAAVGEHWLGAARGRANVICITLGTGIGCGLILGGRLYQGATGGAGELSHIVVAPNGRPCTCGQVGCLESYASGRAITAQALALGFDAADSPPERVFAAAQEGDPRAEAIIQEAMEWLGLALANLVNLFNPDMIVVGGGLAATGDQLLDPIRAAVWRWGRGWLADQVAIVTAELGNDAGVTGGAAIVFNAKGKDDV
jgi:glucokinase